MKKIKNLLLVVLTFVIGLFCLAACDGEVSASNSAAGTYKFVSQTVTQSGQTQEFAVGQEVAGYTFTEDFIILEFKEDGTVVETANSPMGNQEVMNGTWTQDGATLSITINNDTQTGTLDGDTLTIAGSPAEGVSMTLVMKKAS